GCGRGSGDGVCDAAGFDDVAGRCSGEIGSASCREGVDGDVVGGAVSGEEGESVGELTADIEGLDGRIAVVEGVGPVACGIDGEGAVVVVAGSGVRLEGVGGGVSVGGGDGVGCGRGSGDGVCDAAGFDDVAGRCSG